MNTQTYVQQLDISTPPVLLNTCTMGNLHTFSAHHRERQTWMSGGQLLGKSAWVRFRILMKCLLSALTQPCSRNQWRTTGFKLTAPASVTAQRELSVIVATTCSASVWKQQAAPAEWDCNQNRLQAAQACSPRMSVHELLQGRPKIIRRSGKKHL